jgi:putative heme degradation protein
VPPTGPDTDRLARVCTALPLPWVQPLALECAHEALNRAAQAGLALQLWGQGSDRPWQWHGVLHRVQMHGRVVQVQAPGLHLQWDEQQPAGCWWQCTPTRHALLHAVALWDGDGRTLLHIQAARPPLAPEPCAWRDITRSLLDTRPAGRQRRRA